MATCASRRDFLEASAGLALAARTTAASLAAAFAAGPSLAADDEAEYKPRSGQYGKDVIWIPTPDPLVTRMLQLAQVGAADSVVDLGSGDGKIVIAAVREFGARARGIEYNEKMVELSRHGAEKAGLADRATFEQGDLFAADFSSADVVTMYLMPHLNLRLRHTLLAMKPGTRVVSHEFRMGDWEPEESSRIGARSMHLWVVPANAGGDWKTRLQQSRGPIDTTMTIRQRFQVLEGRVALADVQTTMRNARVLGDQIHFAFTDGEGELRTVDARIEPDRMIGAVSTKGGDVAPFVAERVGDTPPIEGSAPMTPDEVRSGS
ncbi:MAG TPA: methyltransferase domain-containing protein [Zeimonas sp.]